MKVTNESKAAVMHRIEAQSISGLTVTEYCAQNEIVKSSYYYWHKKLSEGNPSAGFTPVSVNSSSLVEVTYPNGVQLSFTGEINTVTIKALVCCI